MHVGYLVKIYAVWADNRHQSDPFEYQCLIVPLFIEADFIVALLAITTVFHMEKQPICETDFVAMLKHEPLEQGLTIFM